VGTEKKTFGSDTKHDTDSGFIVSGTVKAGVVKVEIGINLTALKNTVVQAANDLAKLSDLSQRMDFSGPIPQYTPGP
jgi:hypothetical protein